MWNNHTYNHRKKATKTAFGMGGEAERAGKFEKGGLSNVRVLHKTWVLGYLY